jgi:hypothetical protein
MRSPLSLALAIALAILGLMIQVGHAVPAIATPYVESQYDGSKVILRLRGEHGGFFYYYCPRAQLERRVTL